MQVRRNGLLLIGERGRRFESCHGVAPAHHVAQLAERLRYLFRLVLCTVKVWSVRMVCREILQQVAPSRHDETKHTPRT